MIPAPPDEPVVLKVAAVCFGVRASTLYRYWVACYRFQTLEPHHFTINAPRSPATVERCKKALSAAS